MGRRARDLARIVHYNTRFCSAVGTAMQLPSQLRGISHPGASNRYAGDILCCLFEAITLALDPAIMHPILKYLFFAVSTVGRQIILDTILPVEADNGCVE